jgi:ADP-ribose pyrophosphatase YjhB (NUDIX family)
VDPGVLHLLGRDLPDPPTRIAERVAVRAVIRRSNELLLIRSAVGGDVKFPGGGVEADESIEGALRREVREECGREVTHHDEVLLVVDEERRGRDPGWVLRMRSHYVACEVGPATHPLALDKYEQQLGFRPEWITIDAAIDANRNAIADGSAADWVLRELLVLEWLRERWFS